MEKISQGERRKELYSMLLSGRLTIELDREVTLT